MMESIQHQPSAKPHHRKGAKDAKKEIQSSEFPLRSLPPLRYSFLLMADCYL
jgi:hypothetical protein